MWLFVTSITIVTLYTSIYYEIEEPWCAQHVLFTPTVVDVDVDDCDPNPCQNGGTCTDRVFFFMCECLDGFTGNTCQTGEKLSTYVHL